MQKNYFSPKQDGVFVKCFKCKLKPATMKCYNCANLYPGQSVAKFCYSCDNKMHETMGSSHTKEVIPYSEMFTTSQSSSLQQSYNQGVETVSPKKDLFQRQQGTDYLQGNLASSNLAYPQKQNSFQMGQINNNPMSSTNTHLGSQYQKPIFQNQQQQNFSKTGIDYGKNIASTSINRQQQQYPSYINQSRDSINDSRLQANLNSSLKQNESSNLFNKNFEQRKNEITTKLSETNDRFLMPKGNQQQISDLEINKLKLEQQNLKSKNENLRQTLQNHQNQVSELQNQINQIKNKSEQLNASNQQLTQQNNEVEDQKNIQLKEFENNILEAQKQTQFLAEQYEQERNRNEEQGKNLQQRQIQMESNFENQKQQLLSQFSQELKESIQEQLQQQMQAEMEPLIQDHLQKVSKAQEIYDEQRNKNQEIENEISNFQNTQMNEIEEAKQNFQEIINQYESQLQNFQNTLASQDQEIQKLEKQNKEINSSKITSPPKQQQQNTSNTNSAKILKEIEEKTQLLNQLQNDKEQQMEQIKQAFDQKDAEITEMEEMLQQKDEEMQKMQETYLSEEIQQMISAFNEEKEQLINQNQQLQEEHEELSQQLEQYQQFIQQYMNQQGEEGEMQEGDGDYEEGEQMEEEDEENQG